MAKKLIRFDWAMENMLRHKANFGIYRAIGSRITIGAMTRLAINNSKTE